jgi:hypothetical protein
MVVYEGELASFGGQLYQARVDTGLQTLVARAGRDAAQVAPRGEWSASVSYDLLDLVTYREGSYLATRDNPGRPGDGEGGWQVIAAKGARGEPGPRGPRGAHGAAETAVTIRAGSVDVHEYTARPALNNGEVGAILDLRPLFEQFHSESGTA